MINNKLVIAYMVRTIHTNVGFEFWTGIKRACEKNNVHLITFEGDTLGKEGTMIYELIKKNVIDGVVTWAASDNSKFLQFYEDRIDNLPLVSMTLPLPKHPVVKIDSYAGMREAIEHLIDTHDITKIGFIRGRTTNNNNQDRYQAYVDVVKERGLNIDPDLMTEPYPMMDYKAAADAVSYFFDRKKYKPGKDIEAIISITETVAMEVMGLVKARGIKIPEDISIISFDNSIEGKTANPKPTAIILPFRDQAAKAVDTVVDLINGRSVVKSVALPGRLSVNKSCGCQDKTIVLADYQIDNILKTGKQKRFSNKREEFTEKDYQKVITETKNEVRVYVDKNYIFSAGFITNYFSHIDKIIEAFATLLHDYDLVSFQSVLQDCLDYVENNGETGNSLVDIMLIIRRRYLDYTRFFKTEHRVRMSNYIAIASLTITELLVQHEQVLLGFQDGFSLNLREFSATVSATYEEEALYEIITPRLKRLNMPECYIVLYENPYNYEFLKPMPQKSRLTYASRGFERVELENDGVLFSTQDILPGRFFPANKKIDMTIIPLIHLDHQLGYFVSVNGPHNKIVYTTVAQQISNSLHGAMLLRIRTKAEANLAKTLNLLKQKTEIVSNSSLGVSDKVESISISMEAVNKAIKDISDQVNAVMDITKNAVEMTENANKLITTLNEHTTKVGEITNIISDISERTSILSINAAIESARAGTAGKGFSIVATEIKKLAAETLTSTNVINEMIETIQFGSTDTKDVIHRIVDIIGNIDNLSTNIQNAINSHVSTTDAISNNIIEASKGTQDISQAITDVATFIDERYSGKG